MTNTKKILEAKSSTDIDDILHKYKDLSPDEKTAMHDAFNRILAGKMPVPDGPTPPPPDEIQIDPDLTDPEDEPHKSKKDDTDYDDPDKLLKKKNSKQSDPIENESETHKDATEKRLQDLIDQVSEQANSSDLDEETSSEVSKTLADMQKKLDKLSKSAESLSQEEFDKKADEIVDEANEILDKIGNTDIITQTSEKDEEDRLERIQDDSSIETLDELTAEDEQNADLYGEETKKIKSRIKAAQEYAKEIEKARRTPCKTFEQFRADLLAAVTSQVDQEEDFEDDNYGMLDQHHEDDNMVVPSKRLDTRRTADRPIIDVYIDCSGSWDNRDISRGRDAVGQIASLEVDGLITLNINYFSKILVKSNGRDQSAQLQAQSQGSQECWDYIIDDINSAPKSTNVILITDRDIEHNYGTRGHHGSQVGPGTTVDGYVWFIWKTASSTAPSAVAKLKGRQGHGQYTLWS